MSRRSGCGRRWLRCIGAVCLHAVVVDRHRCSPAEHALINFNSKHLAYILQTHTHTHICSAPKWRTKSSRFHFDELVYFYHFACCGCLSAAQCKCIANEIICSRVGASDTTANDSPCAECGICIKGKTGNLQLSNAQYTRLINASISN